MLKVLSQPFPIDEPPGHRILKAVLIGLFVGLFLLVFQPFGLSGWHTPHKAIKILGFGGITTGLTALNFTVWPWLFPRQFSNQGWTVGRHILLVTATVVFIALANRLYLAWLMQADGDSIPLNWTWMIVATFLIAIFPVTGGVLFSYVRQLKKYARSAAQLPLHAPVLANPPATPAQTGVLSAHAYARQPTITLIADNEKDRLTMASADLLFIESSDNYCTVVFIKRDKQPKTLLRSSLSRLMTQIDQPHIVRCHRSFVVNLDRVVRVTGNAQGYKLHLAGDHAIPVSRQYNDTLVATLKALSFGPPV